MGLVYQTNKQTGITYAYENEAYWDKGKQQSRARRKLIGKVDPKTGEIIPTRRFKKRSEPMEAPPAKPGPVPITTMKRCFYGATYLFDQIGKVLGVTEDLKACFPDTYKQILSVAYFLILEENNPLSRFLHWQKYHIHPYGEDLPSQRSSDLFQSIEEAGRMMFFRKQGKRRLEKEYWAFDTTSISSYSETLEQVKKGNNKEHDRLPQLNLALLFGEESGLPFYYRKLAGNIADVATIRELMEEFDGMGYKKIKFVLDRGFYSQKNINALFTHHQRMPVSSELSLNGKLFVEFVALIFLSYVKKKMQDAKLFEKWTLQGLLDEMDSIELFEAPAHGRILGEITKKQEQLYRDLGVNPPSLYIPGR